jgi:hypothetical protein
MDASCLIEDLKKNFRLYLGFHYHFLGGFPSLEADALEALVAISAEKNTKEKVEWKQGGRAAWDVKIGNLTIQVKGGKVEGKKTKKIHLSSFRLGKYIGDSNDPSLLKDGIMENINQIDSWYFFASELLEEGKALRIRFYECPRSSFLYDSEFYNFTFIKKKTAWTYCGGKDGVETQITPRLSHQLWYKTNLEDFNKLAGVKLVFEWDFVGEDLPMPIKDDINKNIWCTEYMDWQINENVISE